MISENIMQLGVACVLLFIVWQILKEVLDFLRHRKLRHSDGALTAGEVPREAWENFIDKTVDRRINQAVDGKILPILVKMSEISEKMSESIHELVIIQRTKND